MAQNDMFTPANERQPSQDEVQRKAQLQKLLDSMHGAANAKDTASMKNILAQARQFGDAGGIEQIYNESIQDAEAQDAARKAAEQRQVDVGNQKNAMINQYGDQARRGLADSILKSKRAAGARGLLYSNQLQGDIASQRSQAAGAMAGYRSKVNEASDEQLGQLAQQSAQRGLQTYGSNIQSNQQQYQDALQRYKQRAGMLGDIGKGIGSAAGAFLPF